MPSSLTLTIPPQLSQSSDTATVLFFGVLARATVDDLGPLRLPAICHDAGRELVDLGLANELTPGCFELMKGSVQLVRGKSSEGKNRVSETGGILGRPFKLSSSASELLCGVLVRAAADGLGPAHLPKICHKAARELVAHGLAYEEQKGFFGLLRSPPAVTTQDKYAATGNRSQLSLEEKLKRYDPFKHGGCVS
jgi:hypothetical protein